MRTDTFYLPNLTLSKHLEEVIEEMRTLGSPKIRVVWIQDSWYAIEGSHRVSAAVILGIPVDVIEVDFDDVITDHDVKGLDQGVTVSEILNELYADPIMALSDVAWI